MSELTEKHIEKLVIHFYQKIRKDALLGPIFNEVAEVDWEHHIPLLCQFWNSIMLKTQQYHGNAYRKHVIIGQKTEIQEVHFARWLELFQQEANKHLPPASAQIIIQRATMIAESLKYGMLSSKKPNSIH